ncbi:hypothetical protein K2W90_04480 [Candidatus Babeliales bacterium]|nr:hypothetical protein [Candidatus Babeliales bacterium]
MKSLCSLVKSVTTLFAVVALFVGSALSAASTNPLNIPTNFASQANIDDLATGYFKQISGMSTVENKIQALSTLIDRSDRATFNASTQTAFGKLVEDAYKMATSESSQLLLLPVLSQAQSSTLLAPVQQNYVAQNMIFGVLKNLITTAAQKSTYQDRLNSLSAITNPNNFVTRRGLRITLTQGVRDLYYRTLVQLYEQRTNQSNQAQAQLRDIMRTALKGSVPLLDNRRRQYVSQQLLPKLDAFKEFKKESTTTSTSGATGTGATTGTTTGGTTAGTDSSGVQTGAGSATGTGTSGTGTTAGSQLSAGNVAGTGSTDSQSGTGSVSVPGIPDAGTGTTTGTTASSGSKTTPGTGSLDAQLATATGTGTSTADTSNTVFNDDRIKRLLDSIGKQPLIENRLRFMSKLTAKSGSGTFKPETQQAYADLLVEVAKQSREVATLAQDLLKAASTSPLLSTKQQKYVTSTMIPQQTQPLATVETTIPGAKKQKVAKVRKERRVQKSGKRQGIKAGKTKRAAQNQ